MKIARPTSIRTRPKRGALAGYEKPAPGSVRTLRVGALAGQKAAGRLIAAGQVVRCSLGPAGIIRNKREGDGATPAGHFGLGAVLVRADRIGRPVSRLPLRPLKDSDGWCDDPTSPLYNCPVLRPFAGRHEALWREDRLYDCVVVVEYNTRHIRKGCGSAIFLHVAPPGLTPTAGCVAITRSALLRLLPRLGPHTRMVIG